MRRREFITLVGGAAAWPLAAGAQQAATMPRIGWIAIGTPQGSEFFEAVRQGLRQLGYVEGQSVIIEPRWTADIGDRVPELVRELLALNVQVIVAQGAIVPVLRRAIESTPVVFGYSGDPVEAGLVNSFGRPGGNFTGATFMSYEVNAKRVEIINSNISNAVVQITQSGKDAISKQTAEKLHELINSDEIKGLPEDSRLDVLDQA